MRSYTNYIDISSQYGNRKIRKNFTRIIAFGCRFSVYIVFLHTFAVQHKNYNYYEFT